MKITDYGIWIGKGSHTRKEWLPIDKPFVLPEKGEMSGFIYFSGRSIAQFTVRNSFTSPKEEIWCFFYIWTDEPTTIIFNKSILAKFGNDIRLLLLTIYLIRFAQLGKYARTHTYLMAFNHIKEIIERRNLSSNILSLVASLKSTASRKIDKEPFVLAEGLIKNTINISSNMIEGI